MANIETLRQCLGDGMVIPACPLVLTARRRWDARRQRALFRYYLAAGAGGLAVGVHTTQFAIRAPRFGLYPPILELAAEELSAYRPGGKLGPIGVAGLCGRTRQAAREATLARTLGYEAGLLSLGALALENDETLIAHCRAIAEIIPLVGFYLQPAVGGRSLSYTFWRRFAEIDRVVAIKIAPFNRYQTIDVIRAVAGAGRSDIALYTGNDDQIVMDLLTPYRFPTEHGMVERHMVGGLLGHWAVWTRRAVELHAACRQIVRRGESIPASLLRLAIEVTDANAAFFDAANHFAGCIPGLHEVLRRQRLLAGTWCLDPRETLSPGQGREIDRVLAAYPHLADDDFVQQHIDQWMA